jgi:hypothetical protein
MLCETMIERRDFVGSPVTVSDATITPLARSSIVRWPGGGAVWSRPAEILVERDGSTDRIPIRNVNGRILWGLRACVVALIAAWIVHDRRGGESNG